MAGALCPRPPYFSISEFLHFPLRHSSAVGLATTRLGRSGVTAIPREFTRFARLAAERFPIPLCRLPPDTAWPNWPERSIRPKFITRDFSQFASQFASQPASHSMQTFMPPVQERACYSSCSTAILYCLDNCQKSLIKFCTAELPGATEESTAQATAEATAEATSCLVLWLASDQHAGYCSGWQKRMSPCTALHSLN